jgi:hypothetical protein
MQERHLTEWAGIPENQLARLGSVRDREQRISLRADLWVRSNSPGKLDQFADTPPVPLESKSGIAVYPTGDFPRLPILGLRALAENKLIFKIDGGRRLAMLRTPFRFWSF